MGRWRASVTCHSLSILTAPEGAVQFADGGHVSEMQDALSILTAPEGAVQ